MRRFADYYDYKYQNPDMRLLVREIIERYEINRNTRMHDKVWIAAHNYLNNAVMKILNTFSKGDLATLVRFALFTGLRGEEIEHVHKTPTCAKIGACNCENLHIVNKDNGISVVLINRALGQKRCYFSMVPKRLWEEFRELRKVDYEFRKFAHLQIKDVTDGQIAFMDLRKFNNNINVRSEMKELGAEVLAGRAKTVSARHYLLNELDNLSEQYQKAWNIYLQIFVSYQ
ncbi:MAG TPA: integrase [Nitrososphaera sp.]|nr:integrase [Nitrososphaera sp.]